MYILRYRPKKNKVQFKKQDYIYPDFYELRQFFPKIDF